MEITRRKALSFGGGLGLLTVSGCAGSPFSAPKLTLTLLNFDSESHFLDVEILRAEGEKRSESIALQEEFELSAPDEGAGAYELQKSDILNSQKYVIRANLRSNQSVRKQFIFYPDCTGDGEPIEELYIEIHQKKKRTMSPSFSLIRMSVLDEYHYIRSLSEVNTLSTERSSPILSSWTTS